MYKYEEMCYEFHHLIELTYHLGHVQLLTMPHWTVWVLHLAYH